MELDRETSTPDIKPERLEAFRQHIINRFRVMKNYRDKIDVDVVAWIKLYNCVKDAPLYTWRSNLFVPYIYVVINTILPRLRAALFGLTSDQVACESFVDQFVDYEKSLAGWFNQKLRRMKFNRKARDSILESLKYPHAIFKVRWVYEKIDGQVVSDDADVDLVPFLDFWWDPNATSESNCKDMIHRIVRDYSYLQAMEKAGRYSNVEKLKDSRPPADIAEIKQDIGQYDAQERSVNDIGFNEKELLEYYGRFDLDGDGVDEEVLGVLGNRDVLMRWKITKCPKPFKIIKPLVEDNQFTGMPMIKLQSGSQHELNTVRNQRIDNINLILDKAFILDPDADIEDPDSVFNGPGHVIKVAKEYIQELDTKDVTQNAAMEEANIKSDMNEVAGISDYWVNSRAKSSDTAKGIAMLSSEAASRFNDMVQNLADQFEDLFQMIYMQYSRFKDAPEKYRTTDELGKTIFAEIPVKALKGEYFFKLVLKNLEKNPAEMQAQLVQIMNIVGKFPWINVRALVKSILEAYNVRNINDIMNAAAYEQQMKAQMAQALAAQSAGAPGAQPGQSMIGQMGTIGGPVDAAAAGPAMPPGRPAA